MSVLLYHEPQVAALCGVHCINALLQGPYFSEIDLAQIAQELDALERQMMQENGVHTEDYLKYMAEASGNVADNGMFSIQVLSKAVEQFGLQLVPLNNPEVVDAKQQPQDQEAFLCNLQEHWFAIRKVDGEWWNFNSLFPAPAPLSSFYLAAFLDTLRHQGYTIFVVQGQFPVRHADQMDSPGAGQWYSPDEARFLTKDAEGSRKRGRAMNAFETAMAQATAGGSSLQLASKHSGAAAGGTSAVTDEERDLAAAIAASLSSFAPPSATANAAATADEPGGSSAAAGPSQAQDFAAPMSQDQGFGGTGGDEEEDPELAWAIAASMADSQQEQQDNDMLGSPVAAAHPEEPEEELGEEPTAGSGVVEIAFRLPGGARASRRFCVHDKLSRLYRFLKDQGLDPRTHSLISSFPRKEYTERDVTIEQAGITDRQALQVDLKRS